MEVLLNEIVITDDRVQGPIDHSALLRKIKGYCSCDDLAEGSNMGNMRKGLENLFEFAEEGRNFVEVGMMVGRSD